MISKEFWFRKSRNILVTWLWKTLFIAAHPTMQSSPFIWIFRNLSSTRASFACRWSAAPALGFAALASPSSALTSKARSFLHALCASPSALPRWTEFYLPAQSMSTPSRSDFPFWPQSAARPAPWTARTESYCGRKSRRWGKEHFRAHLAAATIRTLGKPRTWPGLSAVSC